MKKILILMSDMSCGGVQISLLNFLKHLQKQDVDITILFDSATGAWFDRLPDGIKVEEAPYCCEAYHKLLLPERKVNFIQNVWYHALVHLVDDFMPKQEGRNPRYTFLLKHMPDFQEEYDIAIDYHGYGYITTSILANKVNAKFKAVFIHDEKMDCLWAAKSDLKKIDAFYSVSMACKRKFEDCFPEYSRRSFYFPNYIDAEEIVDKAEAPCPIQKTDDTQTIVTVGRMEWQKGYDLAVNVAKQLKERGIKFQWLCLGDGSQRTIIQKQINENGLHDSMILLGRVDNPYPYIKAADLYVQPSRHEGFGLAVAEALILKKIVVSTDIDCVAEQITNEVNGILVPLDENAFCEAIIRVMQDCELRQNIAENIKSKSNYNSDSYMKSLMEHAEKQAGERYD